MNTNNQPTEIAQQVFTFLTIKEMGKKLSVCKKWFNELTQDDMKELLLKSHLDTKKYSHKEIRNFIKKHQLQLKHIDKIIKNSRLYTPMPSYLESNSHLDLACLLPSSFKNKFRCTGYEFSFQVVRSIYNKHMVATVNKKQYHGYSFGKRGLTRAYNTYQIFTIPNDRSRYYFEANVIDGFVYLVYRKYDHTFEVYSKHEAKSSIFAPDDKENSKYLALKSDNRDICLVQLNEVIKQPDSNCQVM